MDIDLDHLLAESDEEEPSDNENDLAMCRLCGEQEKRKFLIPIFGPKGLKYCLDIKIRKCLPIIVSREDGFPKSICMSCLNKLDITVELFETALRTYHSFLNLVKHNPVEAAEKGKPVPKPKRRRRRKPSKNILEPEPDRTIEKIQIDDNGIVIIEETISINEEPMDCGEITSNDEMNDTAEANANAETQDNATEQEQVVDKNNSDTNAEDIEIQVPSGSGANKNDGIEAIQNTETEESQVNETEAIKDAETQDGETEASQVNEIQGVDTENPAITETQEESLEPEPSTSHALVKEPDASHNQENTITEGENPVESFNPVIN